jgi:putative transposase
MDSAFTRFFREKKGFPKFKTKKNNYSSFQYVQFVSVDFKTNKIKLPKIGKVKFGKSRTFDGKIGTCTISKTPTNKYYISIIVDDGKPIPQKVPIVSDTAVGIDVGIKDFAVLSNGKVYANPKFYEKDEKRLKVLQRRLSRKQKGSKRRERARLAFAKQHEKTHNRRINFIHQVTSEIVRENQTVVIENLNVEGMLKNHNLAKHIKSASWSEFFRQLQYKCEWYGKNLIRIGRFEPSSKMCLCGYINKDLTLKDRKWECPQCGRHNDRDLLAAVNIKRFGLQKQNLIGEISPVVNGAEDVEPLTLVGAKKRQCIIV